MQYDMLIMINLAVDNTRPPIPKHSRFNTPGLQDILRACWNTSPDQRPAFGKITKDLKLLRRGFEQDAYESPRLAPLEEIQKTVASPSPDMRPVSLPQFLQGALGPPGRLPIIVEVRSSDRPSLQQLMTS